MSELVTAKGIAELLTEPPSSEDVLEIYVPRAKRLLKRAVGDVTYAAFLARDLDADEEAACSEAARHYGAYCFLSTRLPPAGSKGMAMQITTGNTTTTMASPETVRGAATAFANQAKRILVEAGLYVYPSELALTAVALSEDD